MIENDNPEPVAYLPFDPPRETVAILSRAIESGLREEGGMWAANASAFARHAAMQLFVDGWRSSEGILHKADNPIPAPRPPHLPAPSADSLRLVA